MAKQKEITKKAKAKRLTKIYIEENLNQSKVAKRRGVTRQAINKQIHKQPVQDILKQYIESDKLKKMLIKVAKEGLGATKVISAFVIVKPNKDGEPNPEVRNVKGDSKTMDFIDIPDHATRHRFWHDLLTAAGVLKVGSDIKVLSQTFVGSDIIGHIKGMENGQSKSRAKTN